MKTTIPNKHESFEKVRKSIMSCKTFRQINSVDHLIRNFDIMFSDIVYTQSLNWLSYDQMAEINNKINP